MKKNTIKNLLCVVIGFGTLVPSPILAQKLNGKPVDPVDLVNPLMGTESKPSLSNGNTYPAVGLPWGMNMWTPQTGKNGDGWQYTYASDKIRGLKQTHQPSPWMNDYGQFSLMPVTGKGAFDQDERASWFSHKAEKSTPYYYSVYLADHDVTAEVTPTERAAYFRFTYSQTDSAFVVLDAFDKGSEVQIIPEKNMVIGYSSRYSRGKLPNFKNYFVLVFDQPFDNFSTWEDKNRFNNKTKSQSNHTGAILGFKVKGKNNPIHVKVASSFISPEQALLNLKEIGDRDFEGVKKDGRAIWNEKLSQLAVEGDNIDQMRTFYSTLYRTLFFPNKLYEINEAGEKVHYSPYNGKVLPGYLFGGTGFWDTFRALYPFLNLMYPSINVEMQEGLRNAYLEGGFLPEWSSPGFADIMIGNNSASVVSDAYMKGLRGYDIETLYEALKHGANNEGPMTAVGRKGVQYYNDLGYVPYDVGINENAARTLEYAYDDFTIYQLAKALKKPKADIELYAKRAQNYRNLFDPSTNLMRGKNKDGNFQSPFNPLKWGDAFTEGNSWHYSWSVFHDVQGLIDLMGGEKVFTHMLDSVFNQKPDFDDSYYGGTIHEIREMQIADMGQYAHGNQPIQHMIYLYNYSGEPWKAQYWIRQVLDRMYKATPDGYCGDEDNGQTSAWYVFSSLGFYPVCPATDEYVLGAPLFPKVTLTLENGKTIEITSTNSSNENVYVNDLKIDGKSHDKNWLSHASLMKGAKLTFDMSKNPNKTRGITKSAVPYSMSNELKSAKK
ncbi:glycoside hydrolase family 92 protein [Sphingobacterium olei]|uniref:Glycoside hydrolase family 92 protein n=1 Tax=Sphingobacterium olei TaxID=2571155 RepID=A0A4U0NAG0_9SPHI|nr:GH92 family glycosyl hydrolase [Sphingobacterium olei]TJZ50879.1 glycoside hydrolase family 92 protein [Sphingobacterium olei]